MSEAAITELHPGSLESILSSADSRGKEVDSQLVSRVSEGKGAADKLLSTHAVYVPQKNRK